VRTATPVAAGPGFGISTVTCVDDHVGWSPAELSTGNSVVLVRRGRFRRSAEGALVDVDPTVGYVGLTGGEERFAHPAGGDLCTAVNVSDPLWATFAGDRDPAPALYVDAALDLAHRRLLRAAGTGDVAFGLAERLVGLLALAVRRVTDRSVPADSRVAPADRALVGAARAAIAADHPAASGLMPLAAHLGASPYRLSRAFSREMGISLTRYRNRMRVGRALDRLEAGEVDGGRLAAELGFADQAHLCRTVREHVGHTPTAVRRLLALPEGGR
jgi:AraC-like DNA-binding protein